MGCAQPPVPAANRRQLLELTANGQLDSNTTAQTVKVTGSPKVDAASWAAIPARTLVARTSALLVWEVTLGTQPSLDGLLRSRVVAVRIVLVVVLWAITAAQILTSHRALRTG